MRINHLLVGLCLTALLGACGSGEGAPVPALLTNAQKIAVLETSGELPQLDRGITIAGIDANANGVRDDIEAYITQKYPQEEQRAAAMQDAAALQAALLTDPTNSAAVKAASLKSSRAINCVFLKFNSANDPTNASPAIVARKTLAMTTNTKARLLAYLAYDNALNGTVISQPEGNTCE